MKIPYSGKIQGPSLIRMVSKIEQTVNKIRGFFDPEKIAQEDSQYVFRQLNKPYKEKKDRIEITL